MPGWVLNTNGAGYGLAADCTEMVMNLCFQLEGKSLLTVCNNINLSTKLRHVESEFLKQRFV